MQSAISATLFVIYFSIRLDLYTCMGGLTYSKVWMNRARLPILLVVTWAHGKMNIPYYSPVPVRAGEFGLARRVQLSRPASACSFSILTVFLPFSAAASIYLCIPPCARGSVPSSSGHAIAYLCCSLPRVRWHRAISLQGSSGNRWSLFAGDYGPINN